MEGKQNRAIVAGANTATRVDALAPTTEQPAQPPAAATLSARPRNDLRLYPEVTLIDLGSAPARGTPPNDDCLDATEIMLSSGDVITVQGNNIGATADCPVISAPPGWAEVWFKIVTDEPLTVTIDYCGTMPPFVLTHPLMFDVCPCAMPALGASSTDSSSCGDGNWTCVWEDLPAGEHYWPLASIPELAQGAYTVSFSAEASVVYTCPENSLVSQPPLPADGPWTGFLSGYSTMGEAEVFERITTTDLISGIQWWGLKAYFNAATDAWEPCDDPIDFQFEITFYENGYDNLPGDAVASYFATPDVIDVGEYWTNSNLLQFNVTDLTPCPLLLDGWVSVKAMPHPSDCSFTWLDSAEGSMRALLLSDGEYHALYEGTALCLSGGGSTPVTGACCMDETPTCTNNADALECLALGGRFLEGEDCGAMDPPCGGLPGACCMPDGTCVITTIGECMGDWLGAYTTCDMCPCTVPCPPEGITEPEVCGESTNNGCTMDIPAFTPIACGDTFCGTLWAQAAQRDTDWYQVFIDEWSTLIWTADAEIPFRIMVTQAGELGCEDALDIGQYYGSECDPGTIVTGALPPGEYWVRIMSSLYTGAPCEQQYTATLTCEPAAPDYCAVVGACGAILTRVRCGDIDFSSACDGYLDNSNLTTDVPFGGSIPLLMNAEYMEGSIRYSVWVDWNDDMAFTDNELVETYAGGETVEFLVVPPADTVLGPVRMRIVTSSGYTDAQPCGLITDGDAEDYTLNVVEHLGACCMPDGSCEQVLPSQCMGVYLGADTMCAGEDCNGNGSDDAYDLFSGYSADCNGNGVPDECDIANCPPGDPACTDCQGNGIPDGCELDNGTIAYQVDDGVSEASLGLTAGGYWCWFNAFTVEAGAETLSEVQVAYGVVANGTPATIYVWSDPTQDGDPNDAQVLVSVQSEVIGAQTDTFITVALPPTYIGPEGTIFYVGALVQHAEGDHPSSIDLTTSARSSWFCGSTVGPIDPNRMGDFVLRSIDSQSWAGNWMIRADAIASADCNGNLVPDECESDCDGDGIPDDCELCGDLNDDDAVDYDDYVIFLAAFGGAADGTPPEDWCCDYDGSGAVGLQDYAAWLECYRAYVGNPFAGAPSSPGVNPRKQLSNPSTSPQRIQGARSRLP